MNWFKKLLGGEANVAGSESSVTLDREGDLYVLQVSGALSKGALDRIQTRAGMDMDRGATQLKVMLVLHNFRGWRRGDDWADLDFFAKYEQNIAKIAVVGDPKWETEVLMFLASGRRKGEVRFFAPDRADGARAWLAT